MIRISTKSCIDIFYFSYWHFTLQILLYKIVMVFTSIESFNDDMSMYTPGAIDSTLISIVSFTTTSLVTNNIRRPVTSYNENSALTGSVTLTLTDNTSDNGFWTIVVSSASNN